MVRATSLRRPLLALGAVLASASLAIGTSVAEARLVFKRADGSVIRFKGTPRAWCGLWEEDVERPSIHVGIRGAKRGWQLSAVRRDVKVGRRITFPNTFVWNRPRRASLFVADAPNEASTAEGESSGSMVFSRLSCRRGGVLAFRIDAVLGSELSDGKPVRVSGTYRGRVSPASREASGEGLGRSTLVEQR